MKHERFDYGDVTLLRLQGDLGKPEAEELAKIIDKLIHEGHAKIVLDLEEIRYADSHAIMTLLRLDRECLSVDGEIKLLRPRSVVKQFMNIGQVLELFERFETKFEAINSFHKKNPDQKPSAEPTLEQLGKQQKIVILRLIEILIRKGYFSADEFSNEYNRSAQLVVELFRKELQS